ncbi:MAG: hypothetical protein H6Q72_3614 [Firmicutes bacterium]|nr:hypothetical protein [Bacillota bacterium]
MLKMQFSDTYNGLIRQFLLHMLLWGLVIILGASLFRKVYIMPGFLIGWTSSLFYFLYMCHKVKKSAELPQGKAIASMRTGWLFRYGFMISILVLSVKIPGINFWAAVVGLFSLHIVLMLQAVCIVVSGLVTNVGKSKINL